MKPKEIVLKFLTESGRTLEYLDIGCSGYIPNSLTQFPDFLYKYYGVDPLSNEVERLRKVYPSAKYIDAFIIAPGTKG